MPRLAMSHGLWGKDEDDAALAQLCTMGVEGLVVSPENVIGGLSDLSGSLKMFSSYSAHLGEFGLTPVSLQSIIPVEEKGRIFGPKGKQKTLLERIDKAAEAAVRLGVSTMTFSAPALRNEAFADCPEDFENGVEFFSKVSKIGAEHSIRVMVEPCPQDYGCDFGRTLAEVSRVLSEVKEPAGLGIHLNTGAMLLEEGMPKVSVAAHGAGAHHIDVVDPFERTLSGGYASGHQAISTALGRLRSLGHGPRWIVVSGRRPRSVAAGGLSSFMRDAVIPVRAYYLESC